FGVIMGYYLGKGKFSRRKERRKWILYSLLIPFFLHGTYDYILKNISNWMILMVPFMMYLWWFGLRKVKMVKHQ
ncbi:PrsW family glutamic-type intramembrane protease, partial [Klebsiella pneumoniae]|uniref:PrsW family glutamic-type intramembrane protease n=2 Tax=Bacteria TaxID=2 RepID=UPI00298CCED1